MGSGPLWADLHNHNEIGYGVGSLERALRLARQRLDVWAFTAHAYWHDIPPDPESPEVKKHEQGFRRVREAWPTVLERFAGVSDGVRFLALPAFEWHSSANGDRHVLAPRPSPEFAADMTPDELAHFARGRDALLIPHHLAYPPGARGVNWSTVDDELSPVAEVFSEHGSSVADDGDWPMDGHSMSPRSTQNTWVKGLERGLRLGAVASTDNHDGCPGAYNEGLAGIWAESPTVEAVFNALRQRRCYGVTGDRITLDWSLDDAVMGTVVDAPFGRRRTFRCRVHGWDEIDTVDLVRNGRLWRRFTPGLDAPTGRSGGGAGTMQTIVRWRWGWGPMGSREILSWQGRLHVHGGAIHHVMPAFGSTPPGDGPDGEYQWTQGNGVHTLEWTSRTSRSFPQGYDQFAAVIEGGPNTELEFDVACAPAVGPSRSRRAAFTLQDVVQMSREVHMAEPPFTPTFQVLRALPVETCGLAISESIDGDSLEQGEKEAWPRDCLFVRVRQKNGQMAWSSPIWFTERG